MKLSISKNAHPNTDGSPWGWIVIDGTRIRVATWSGYDEQKRCDEVITTVNNHASLKQQLSELREERDRLRLTLSGKTFFDEREVMQKEITELREENERLKEGLHGVPQKIT